MKLSYLVLTHNEPQAIELIDLLYASLSDGDEIVILDDYSTDGFLDKYANCKNITITKRHLHYSYSEHRNYALAYCTGDYILALDADERLASFLKDNLQKIITDTKADVIWLPRVNIVEGIPQLIAWPDYQCRLFRNGIGLQWQGNLHERLKINPEHKQVVLQPDAALAIVHRKTLEQQKASTERYLAKYTDAENKGLN